MRSRIYDAEIVGWVLINMDKNNFQTKDKDFEFTELKHSMNNDLSIISSFLVLCHTVTGDETFQACLENAEKSLRRIVEGL